MIDRNKVNNVASGLHDGEIQEALKSQVRCNAEYINKETGHVVILTGCIPIMAKDSRIEGLVLGLCLPKGVRKPDNYTMGTKCYINGVEHPILTNEMILNGEF